MILKTISKLAIILFVGVGAQAESSSLIEIPTLPPFGNIGNPEFLPVEENPGPDAEVIEQLIHDKLIVLADSQVKMKWTSLGYGAVTEKVIIPELAAHTVFNHRNPGEEGPCLRSYRQLGATPLNPVNQDLVVSIQILNRYEMNRDKKICRVSMVEHVTTEIAGTEFSHSYTKPMGFRYIGDCPAQN